MKEPGEREPPDGLHHSHQPDVAVAGFNVLADDLHKALCAVACADLALLLLPLALLTTAANAEDACGWNVQRLDIFCALALIFLWVSVVVTAAQLMTLSVARRNRRHALVRRLWWHLPASVLATCIGGAVDIYALGGYMILQRGECKSEFQHILGTGVGLGYLLGSIYALLSVVEAKTSHKRVDSAPERKLCHDLMAPLQLTSAVPSAPQPSSFAEVDDAGRHQKDLGKTNSRATQLSMASTASSDRHGNQNYSSNSSLESTPKSSPASSDTTRVVEVASPVIAGLTESLPREGKRGLRSSKTSARSNSISLVKRPDGIRELRISVTDRSSSKTLDSPFVGKASDRGARRFSDKHAVKETRLIENRRASAPSSCREQAPMSLCPLHSMVATTPTGETLLEDPLEELFDDKFKGRRTSFKEGDDPCGRLITEKTMSVHNSEEPFPHGLLQGAMPTPECSQMLSDGTRMSRISFQAEVEVTEILVESEMRKSVNRRYSPIVDETVFQGTANPINFHSLRKVSNDDGDSEEPDGSSSEYGSEQEGEIGEEGNEVWHSPREGKVEVPVWLLERLQASGIEIPDEESPKEESDSDSDSKNWGERASDRQRSTSQLLQETSKVDGKRTSKSGNTFWKIPMPTRKSSMQIHVSPPDQGRWESTASPRSKDADNSSIPDDEEEDENSDTHDSDAFDEEQVMRPDFDAKQQRGSTSSIGRRISFMDEELGTPLEKYSDEKKERKAAKLQLRTSLGAIKEAKQENQPSRSRLAPASAKESSTLNIPKKASRRNSRQHGSRRPSVLGLFSDDSAKGEGLYVVNNQQEQNKNEVVQVRRKSLVMSNSMLVDIFKSKVDNDRMMDIAEGSASGEVVLPFFSASQTMSGPPPNSMCSCATDPVTGFVIHTCMTPCTTAATNTHAFTSYVCSAWGSRSGSRRGSKGHTRRGSEGLSTNHPSKYRRFSGSATEADDADEAELEDGVVPPPPPPPRQFYERKRIRNASMLASVGAKGPKPATKVELDEDPSNSKDNELAISFQNIQNLASASRRGSIHSASHEDSRDARHEDPSATDNERSVESEIGHRFDLVEPVVLADMLAQPDTCEQVLTVDVRGRDWAGGHIPSSINLRTSEVTSNPTTLLVKCRQNRVHHIVFTCMYSVLRARKCAQAVEKAQEDERKAGFAAYRIRISLLAGGMHAWVNHFIKNPHNAPPKAYIDSFDPDMWSDGGPSQGGLVHVMDALWSSGGQKALSDALSQELEQLLMVRRCSNQSSRRASKDANEEKEQQALDSETAAVAFKVAHDLVQMRQSSQKAQRRESDSEIEGFSLGSPRSGSDADSDMT